jgi:hypothetical protein
MNKKIEANMDDFCIHCMEWTLKNKEGKCSKCGKDFMTVTSDNVNQQDLYGKRGYKYGSNDNPHPMDNAYEKSDQNDW